MTGNKLKNLNIKDLLSDFKNVKKLLEAEIELLLICDGQNNFTALIEKLTENSTKPGLKVVEFSRPVDEVLIMARASDICLIGLTDENIPTSFKDVVRQIEYHNLTYILFVELKNIDKLESILKKIDSQTGIKADDIPVVNTETRINLDELAERTVARLKEIKRIAIGRNYPFFRGAASNDIISRTAKQNGLASTIIFTAADFPVLTGNQIKMLLELAAIYGEELDERRIKELLAVFGTGYSLRTIARSVIGFFPGPQLVIKGLISYFGTLAMGKGAISYFESERFEKIRAKSVI